MNPAVPRVLPVLALYALALTAPGEAVAATSATGAGGSFSAPVIQAWAAAFERRTGSRIAYSSVGSAEGIREVTAGTVDFAVSDLPLTTGELQSAGLIQFPIVIGGVVPVVNLPGVEPHRLRLTGATLSALFLGKISRWSDPALREANPNVALPDIPVLPVHRSDGSGTTYLFTTYLVAANADWRRQIGSGTLVAWPTGSAAEGNRGVAAAVRAAPGAIGYVEYSYGMDAGAAPVALSNKSGEWVHADEASFRAAIRRLAWERPSFAELPIDRDEPGGWPIVGASYALVPRRPRSDGPVAAFFEWAVREGGKIAADGHYVPLDDDAARTRIMETLKGARQAVGSSSPRAR